jgi:hypothetical protein
VSTADRKDSVALEADDRVQMERLRETVQEALAQMASIVARYLNVDPQEQEAIFRFRNPGRNDWIQILEGRTTNFSACYRPDEGAVSMCGRPPDASVRRDLMLIGKAVTKRGFDPATTVLISRDEKAISLRDDLAVSDLAEGFQRWLLPIVLGGGSGSLLVASPNASTPAHSHTSRTLHLVASGSVTINDEELSPGDWAYIPRGFDYTYRVGPEGALSFYIHD